MKIHLRSFFVPLMIIGAFFGSAHAAHAATLYFSPSAGSFKIGQTFAVNVIVSSPDEPLNAVSGAVSYSQENLEVISLSRGGSIISLWVQEPSFTQSVGMVNFEGIVLNPGFKGASGKILTINFRAKAIGTAAASFTSGAILANDGQGTNILTGMGRASYMVVGGAPVEPKPPPTPSPTPPAITGQRISSPTHPDQGMWYASSHVAMQWDLPSGTLGVSTVLDKSPAAIPAAISEGVFSSKSFDVDDGVWYQHVRIKTAAGWGAASHYRLNVDTRKPALEIHTVSRSDGTEPHVKFLLKAEDKGSGIAVYRFQIDDLPPVIQPEDGSHQFVTSAVIPGKHTLMARATDRVGNFTEVTVAFDVQALNAPTLTVYPSVLRTDESLIVRGTTYPNATVTIRLRAANAEPRSFAIHSDDHGNFSFITDERFAPGRYNLWAEVMDERGAKSNPSHRITFAVASPLCCKIGGWEFSAGYLFGIVALILLIFLFIFWSMWHHLTRVRRTIHEGMYRAEAGLHKAFDLLREDIGQQIKLLEHARSKRELTEEEGRILARLKRDLSAAERVIKNKIRKIGE
ncbi:MAG: cohesin domain-containing protein [Candidatus Uhrbacteria bacterium]|nr:cohesin domain-containing protein [Candidatus Uhrbacteria bacterium]